MADRGRKAMPSANHLVSQRLFEHHLAHHQRKVMEIKTRPSSVSNPVGPINATLDMSPPRRKAVAGRPSAAVIRTKEIEHENNRILQKIDFIARRNTLSASKPARSRTSVGLADPNVRPDKVVGYIKDSSGTTLIDCHLARNASPIAYGMAYARKKAAESIYVDNQYLLDRIRTTRSTSTLTVKDLSKAWKDNQRYAALAADPYVAQLDDALLASLPPTHPGQNHHHRLRERAASADPTIVRRLGGGSGVDLIRQRPGYIAPAKRIYTGTAAGVPDAPWDDCTLPHAPPRGFDPTAPPSQAREWDRRSEGGRTGSSGFGSPLHHGVENTNAKSSPGGWKIFLPEPELSPGAAASRARQMAREEPGAAYEELGPAAWPPQSLSPSKVRSRSGKQKPRSTSTPHGRPGGSPGTVATASAWEQELQDRRRAQNATARHRRTVVEMTTGRGPLSMTPEAYAPVHKYVDTPQLPPGRRRDGGRKIASGSTDVIYATSRSSMRPDSATVRRLLGARFTGATRSPVATLRAQIAAKRDAVRAQLAEEVAELQEQEQEQEQQPQQQQQQQQGARGPRDDHPARRASRPATATARMLHNIAYGHADRTRSTVADQVDQPIAKAMVTASSGVAGGLDFLAPPKRVSGSTVTAGDAKRRAALAEHKAQQEAERAALRQQLLKDEEKASAARQRQEERRLARQAKVRAEAQATRIAAEETRKQKFLEREEAARRRAEEKREALKNRLVQEAAVTRQALAMEARQEAAMEEHLLAQGRELEAAQVRREERRRGRSRRGGGAVAGGSPRSACEDDQVDDDVGDVKVPLGDEDMSSSYIIWQEVSRALEEAMAGISQETGLGGGDERNDHGENEVQEAVEAVEGGHEDTRHDSVRGDLGGGGEGSPPSFSGPSDHIGDNDDNTGGEPEYDAASFEDLPSDSRVGGSTSRFVDRHESAEAEAEVAEAEVEVEEGNMEDPDIDQMGPSGSETPASVVLGGDSDYSDSFEDA